MLRDRTRIVALLLATLSIVATAPSASADPAPKITNGHDATPGQWPFMVGLLFANVDSNFDAQFCGGALVKADWVLTAAHCIVQDPQDLGPDDIDVLVGSTDLDAQDGTRVRADAVVVHPDYSRSSQANDIALVHVTVDSGSVTINAATPSEASFESPGVTLTLLGWGGLTTNQADQTYAHRLQEATMPVLANRECSGPGFEAFDASVMLCAGAPEQDADGGVDACQGDSGGPLFATDPNGQPVEIGIVSFGPTCGQSPTAYTRVSHFNGWIAETTKDVSVDEDETLPLDVFRVAGANRYATAAAFALDRWTAPIDTVYVVTGEAFADALAMAPVASRGDGPVLLVRRDSLPAETAQAIDRLQPSNVVLAGGTGAISTAVEEAILRRVPNVSRFAGSNRYATAVALSAQFFRRLPAQRSVVFVGSGERFADALGGASAAADRSVDAVPLLLTMPTTLPEETRAELSRLAPEQVFVLGGTAAVSDEVVDEISALGIPVIRLAGVDRYDTAAQIAINVFGQSTEVIVATGLGFPDGLVSGALGNPLLLVPSPDSMPATVTGAIDSMGTSVITIMGGRGAVSTSQAEALAGAR